MNDKVRKKINLKRISKNVLISIGLLVLIFGGYNLKIRMDEKKYNNNLENHGWKLEETMDIATDNNNSRKLYELKEDGITYNTYVMMIKSPQLKFKDYSPSIIATKGKYQLSHLDKKSFAISVELGAHKTTVNVDNNLNLTKNNPNWGNKDENKIKEYISKNKDTYLKLLKGVQEKKAEL